MSNDTFGNEALEHVSLGVKGRERVSVSPALCTICEWRPVYAKARCRSCYVFERRHGRDKTEAEVVAEGQRILANHTPVIYARA